MAITSIPTSTQTTTSNVSTVSPTPDNLTTPSTTQSPPPNQAAIYEKSDPTTTNPKQTYTRDTVKLDEINRQVDMKLSSLRSTVENLVSMQSVKNGEAKGLNYDQILAKYDGKLKDFYQNLNVDDKTRLTAQQDISEDGFWGVKQTSQRAIDFAKALCGGDPSKVAALKSSIEEGYRAAEKSWGGELPEICKQTQAATLKGLDDWAKESTPTS